MTPLDALVQTVRSGNAILFTGAGFSSDARDLDGAPLPDGPQMVEELWALCFGQGERDDSSLPDLYDVALLHKRDALERYLTRRLRIDERAVSAHVARWFAAPWIRIYTLNVDDLEEAVARRHALPRRLRSISALADDEAAACPASTLEVVHLNGMVTMGPSQLTFSTMQYAARLCGQDREYARLAEDLARAPFVFAGTTLDEATLWQHVERQRRRGAEASRAGPTSFLVSRHLSRARQALLEHLRIRWVEASIADVAAQL